MASRRNRSNESRWLKYQWRHEYGPLENCKRSRHVERLRSRSMALAKIKKSSLRRRLHALRYKALALLVLLFAASNAAAQNLEPRSYVNTPVGMHFLIGAYAYTEGKLEFDPTLPIADATYHQDTVALGYAHSFGVWGKSAKFDVIVPYSSFSGHADVNGQQRFRQISGYQDPLFRVSVNFYGAPALTAKEFASYQQDLLIGASVQVSAPLGQYDNTRLINLGNNRWAIKPQLGISKAWDAWTLELAPGVTFYTDNTDFNQGGRFEQAPLYSVQAHLVHAFASGIWVALDGTYFSGGRTKLNGVQNDTLQSNTRGGVTLAIPVDRNNSIKLYAFGGTTTRTGTTANSAGVAWQYRWGGGY